MSEKEAVQAERIKALEERVAYLEGLVRELIARPQAPIYVTPPAPQPVAPVPEIPWSPTCTPPYRWGEITVGDVLPQSGTISVRTDPLEGVTVTAIH